MTVGRHWCLSFQPIHSFSGHALACYCSITSDSLWPLDCSMPGSPSSPLPRACSNSCPLSRWCHPTNALGTALLTGIKDESRCIRTLQGTVGRHAQATFRSVTGRAQCDETESEKPPRGSRLSSWELKPGEKPLAQIRDREEEEVIKQTEPRTQSLQGGRAASHTHRRDGGCQTRSTRTGWVLRQKQEATQLQREAGCKAQLQRWGIPRTPPKSSHGDDCTPGRLVCSPCSLPASAPFPPREPKGCFCHVMRYNRPSLQGHTLSLARWVRSAQFTAHGTCRPSARHGVFWFSRESCLVHYLATDTPCLPTSEDIRICLWFRLLGAVSQVSREPSPSSPYEKSVRTSLAALWLTLCFPTPVVWVRSLVRELWSHMISGQKTKTWNRRIL